MQKRLHSVYRGASYAYIVSSPDPPSTLQEERAACASYLEISYDNEPYNQYQVQKIAAFCGQIPWSYTMTSRHSNFVSDLRLTVVATVGPEHNRGTCRSVFHLGYATVAKCTVSLIHCSPTRLSEAGCLGRLCMATQLFFVHTLFISTILVVQLSCISVSKVCYQIDFLKLHIDDFLLNNYDCQSRSFSFCGQDYLQLRGQLINISGEVLCFYTLYTLQKQTVFFLTTEWLPWLQSN